MSASTGDVMFVALIGAAIGIVIGWKIRSIKVEELLATVERANTRISGLSSIEIDLKRRIDEMNAEISSIKGERSALQGLFGETLSSLRKDGALLPSLVEWSDRIQATQDEILARQLTEKVRSAPKAAEEVREARSIARNWRRQAETLKNQIALYESQAPWLCEFTDYSVQEIVDGLRQEEDLEKAFSSGSDPVRLFLSPGEWSSLTNAQKNQLALDRYWAYRQKNAWAAGIQYERYIGYLYEQRGFRVIYHGATLGVEDLGIDLVCTREGITHLVQCKRLSVEKGLPVRENVVAQIFGASIYYAHKNELARESVHPVIFTTFELSEEARQFASALRVEFHERQRLESYPCIKCNISGRSLEKIYHLPFDQQYDSTRVEVEKGELYALTVSEAEALGFRRAFRWRG